MRAVTGWMLKSWCALGIVVSGHQTLQAHPGHALEVSSGNSPLHYVLHPEHFGGALLLGGVMFLIVMKLLYIRRRPRAELARVRR